MPINVAINGYGRIGRNTLRALYEAGRTDEIAIVAINDLGDAATNAHLTRYDTAHGKFPGEVAVDGDDMVVNGDRIRVLAERDPAKLPWAALEVDLVLECTGLFTSKAKAGAHIQAGAGKVIISAPGDRDVDATVVYGVNHDVLRAEHTVISNASCTTNCLAPLVKPLHEKIGIESGLITTVHPSTVDQTLTDIYRKDLHRARSATRSMIPIESSAGAVIGRVLPALKNRLGSYTVRVPVINVSMMDITLCTARVTSREEIDAILREAAGGRLKNILEINDEPLVSIDFNHTTASSTCDTSLTKVIDGTLVKVVAWFDNERGYARRLLDTAMAMAQAASSNPASTPLRHDNDRDTRLQAQASPPASLS